MCQAITGQFGSGLYLDGSGDCVRSLGAADTDLEGPKFTIEIWFKYQGVGNGTAIWTYGSALLAEWSWRVEVLANTPDASHYRINLQVKTIASGLVTVFTYDVAENSNWNHIAWLYDEAGDTSFRYNDLAISTIASPVADLTLAAGVRLLVLSGGTQWAFDNNRFNNVIETLSSISTRYTSGF